MTARKNNETKDFDKQCQAYYKMSMTSEKIIPLICRRLGGYVSPANRLKKWRYGKNEGVYFLCEKSTELTDLC